MSENHAARALIRAVLAEGRDVLQEHELLDLFEAAGQPTPKRAFISQAALPTFTVPADFPAERGGVLKVVSPQILHKTDLGCVAFLNTVTPEAVIAAATQMQAGLPAELASTVQGYLLEERIAFTGGVGRELLVGMRHAPEFGPVYTVGFGGTYVEALAEATRADQSTVLYTPGVTEPARLDEKLAQALFFRWTSGQVRGVKGATTPEALKAALTAWVAVLESIRAAALAEGAALLEIELNPLVFGEAAAGAGLFPVDALARLGRPELAPPTFEMAYLKAALAPQSVAIVGVSTRMNMGRIILGAALAAGFDPKRLYTVRPDGVSVDGAPCVRTLAELPEKVDLLVVAVGAKAVPELLKATIEADCAKALLLIPGGMGETEGGKGIAAEVEALIAAASPERRPVLLGNNSLGLVSRKARFDSLFIPELKLPRRRDGQGGVALVSQSGAFIITQLGKLAGLTPEYQVSLGNQMDARLSHVVEALGDDPAVHTFGLYIEGLKPEDGVRLAAQLRRLRAQGKTVVIYKGGRSALGRAATAGHTASVSGDYRIFKDVLEDAGAVVVESFADFRNLLVLSAGLAKKTVAGLKTAFMSNAGYEVVGMSDNHKGQGFELKAARLAEGTVRRLAEVLEVGGLAALVAPTNPLDLTPMADDRAHEDSLRALLDDPNVDAIVAGNIPLTAQIRSLPRGLSETDVFDHPEGYGPRVCRLFAETDKPLIVVLDSSSHYDALFGLLETAGVPVFRDADQAVCALGRYLTARLSPR